MEAITSIPNEHEKWKNLASAYAEAAYVLWIKYLQLTEAPEKNIEFVKSLLEADRYFPLLYITKHCLELYLKSLVLAIDSEKMWGSLIIIWKMHSHISKKSLIR
jgi:hypothetical protein